jgi:hypothetical protein
MRCCLTFIRMRYRGRELVGTKEYDVGGWEMKVLVDGIIYDSTKTSILIEFDENEQAIFNGMKRFVSAPEDSTEKEREILIGARL